MHKCTNEAISKMFRPTKLLLSNTALHGFRYPKRATPFPIWLVPLTVALSVCFYEANSTITKYLLFGQKLTLKSKNTDTADVGGQEFPAITICPRTVYRKSVVGGYGIGAMASGAYVDWGDMNEALALDKGGACAGVLEHKIFFAFDQPGSKFGWANLGRKYMVDSFHSALDCRFQGKKLNCSNLFYNSWTDVNGCFTFNIDPLLIAADFINNNTEMSYGTEGYNLPNNPVTGRSTGVQITLNANVDDYCYPLFPYGSGFFAFVHDRKTVPLLKFLRQVDLAPGFATNVRITKKEKTMSTEKYGYCISTYNYTLYKPAPYQRGNCIKECLTLEVLHTCGCLPFYSPILTYWKGMDRPLNIRNVSSNMYFTGTRSEKKFFFCSPLNGPCMKPLEKTFANGTCKQKCPQPCSETKFSFSTSQSRYPTSQSFNMLKRQFGSPVSEYSLEKARQNLVVANFYFASMVNTVEQVDISMTWIDLVAQLGGALGLSLGASMVSLIEIIAWLIWQPITLLASLISSAYCYKYRCTCTKPVYIAI